jgi:hypothetical protein
MRTFSDWDGKRQGFVEIDSPGAVLTARTTNERLALLEDSVSPSYEYLSPELQKLWRCLSLFPGGFDGVDAGAIWGINEAAAQEFLSLLLACNMLQWSESPPQYKLHDLLRLWASARCSDDERRSVQQELAEYAATILARANEMYRRGGEGLRQALDVFDRKRANMEAGWGVGLRKCGPG